MGIIELAEDLMRENMKYEEINKELLEACKDIAKYLQVNKSNEWHSGYFKELKQAIALAEGER